MLPVLHLHDNGVPVYVQIRDQMLQAIGAGKLRPGEQMPTMRQVAVALKVDLNTVRHAYADLEQTGAIVIRRARGTYVAERPPPIDVSRQTKRMESLAHQAIATANAAGIDPIRVAKAMLQILKGQRDRK
jgi:GntR family transcriptional regulator